MKVRSIFLVLHLASCSSYEDPHPKQLEMQDSGKTDPHLCLWIEDCPGPQDASCITCLTGGTTCPYSDCVKGVCTTVWTGCSTSRE